MADLEVSPEVWGTHVLMVRQPPRAPPMASSASQAAMAGLPFGLLCTPLFPPPYEVAKIAFDQGLSSTSKQIGTGASTLRQVASNFETTDADVANRGQRYYL